MRIFYIVNLFCLFFAGSLYAQDNWGAKLAYRILGPALPLQKKLVGATVEGQNPGMWFQGFENIAMEDIAAKTVLLSRVNVPEETKSLLAGREEPLSAAYIDNNFLYVFVKNMKYTIKVPEGTIVKTERISSSNALVHFDHENKKLFIVDFGNEVIKVQDFDKASGEKIADTSSAIQGYTKHHEGQSFTTNKVDFVGTMASNIFYRSYLVDNRLYFLRITDGKKFQGLHLIDLDTHRVGYVDQFQTNVGVDQVLRSAGVDKNGYIYMYTQPEDSNHSSVNSPTFYKYSGSSSPSKIESRFKLSVNDLDSNKGNRLQDLAVEYSGAYILTVQNHDPAKGPGASGLYQYDLNSGELKVVDPNAPWPSGGVIYSQKYSSLTNLGAYGLLIEHERFEDGRKSDNYLVLMYLRP